jgi:hypothetical protein
MALRWFVLCLAIVLAACDAPASTTSGTPLTTPVPMTVRDLQIVTGQTLYVPAYSEIFYGSPNRTLDLSVTLAIHNTDPTHAIIIQSAAYYDTNGEQVRDYVSDPVELAPLATTGFIVEDRDDTGGWGANFIVRWGAEQPVYEPVVEAIMVSTQGTQGISLISPGRIISQNDTPAEATPENE